MNVSVILAHPEAGSFNHAIAEAAVSELRFNGHAVTFHDLYAEGFDPVLPGPEAASGAALPPSVAVHCVEIAAAEGIVIVHPNWWGQPPAILTGWIDRVIRTSVGYRFLEGDAGDGVPLGLLKAKAAVVFNTSNTPAEREQAVFGDPLELIWKKCVFGLCGVEDVHREVLGVVVTSTLEQRQQWLARVRDVIARRFPKEVPRTGAW
jgi:putative NADPH-quinone reductase